MNDVKNSRWRCGDDMAGMAANCLASVLLLRRSPWPVACSAGTLLMLIAGLAAYVY